MTLAQDSFDANLAEVLRSTGRWHWKLEIGEVVEDIAEAISSGERGRYERVRSALLLYYTEQYRRPSTREYRAYLREKRTCSAPRGFALKDYRVKL